MNEEWEWSSDLGGSNQNANAWRRPPAYPDWRVYVTYGDSGYECDPGTYGEPIDRAISDIDDALSNLASIRAALVELKNR